MPYSAYINELSTGTARAYGEDLNDFARWFIQTNGEELSPERITSIDIRDYQANMILNRGLKPSTVNRRLAAIRSWLKWCVEQGEIESLPRWPKRAQQNKHAPKALDKKEQDRFIRAVEREGCPRDMAIVGLMLFAGLRVSEAARTKTRDIKLSERKGQVTVTGKGSKQRVIPLGLDARNMIRDWYDQAKGEWLFPGQNGRPISTRAVQQMIKKYAWLAKIDPDKVTPHILRHTFATNLLRDGVDIVLVAHLLGHARLDTTAIYTLPSYSQMEMAVE